MIIWITGCTAGLGRALLAEFIKAGHTVAGCGRNEIALQHLKNEHPSAHLFTCDVSQDQSADNFCVKAHLATGTPDLVINNAAIINPPRNLWEIPATEFNQLTSININGVANIIRHSLPDMIAEGKGIIANLSSGWGRSTSPEVAPYCASKWAIEGLTKALAEELPSGLAAVAVSPGIVSTDMLHTCMGEDAKNYPTPEAWAITAAPFFTSLTTDDNGQSLTTP